MPAGRNVKLACSVKNLGSYKVSSKLSILSRPLSALSPSFCLSSIPREGSITNLLFFNSCHFLFPSHSAPISFSQLLFHFFLFRNFNFLLSRLYKSLSFAPRRLPSRRVWVDNVFVNKSINRRPILNIFLTWALAFVVEARAKNRERRKRRRPALYLLARKEDSNVESAPSIFTFLSTIVRRLFDD